MVFYFEIEQIVYIVHVSDFLCRLISYAQFIVHWEGALSKIMLSHLFKSSVGAHQCL